MNQSLYSGKRAGMGRRLTGFLLVVAGMAVILTACTTTATNRTLIPGGPTSHSTSALAEVEASASSCTSSGGTWNGSTCSANPLANESGVCVTLVHELQSRYGFTFTYNNKASAENIDFVYPTSMTYGQLGDLGAGTHGNKHDLARLSFLAYGEGDRLRLIHAMQVGGMSTVNPVNTKIFPRTISGVPVTSNSVYHKLQVMQVPAGKLAYWINHYLTPVIHDCAEGD